MGTLGVVARPSHVQSTYNQSELLDDLKSFDAEGGFAFFNCEFSNSTGIAQSASVFCANKQTNKPDKRCSVLELNFVEVKSSDPALSHLGCCLTQLISYLRDIRYYASS